MQLVHIFLENQFFFDYHYFISIERSGGLILSSLVHGNIINFNRNLSFQEREERGMSLPYLGLRLMPLIELDV